MNLPTLESLAFANFFFLAISVIGLFWILIRLRTQYDISENLRKDAEKYQELFDLTLDGVFMTDSSGRFEYINQSGANILGFRDPRECSEANLFNIISLAESSNIVNQKIIRGYYKNQLIELKKDDSISIFIELTANPRLGADGALKGYNAIFRDVTKRLKTENELKRHQDQLEEMLAERTNDLQKINLNLQKEAEAHHAAKETIEHALAEKNELLKEIHHRIKNNLQLIVSLLNLQIKKIDDEKILKELQKSLERIRAMTLIHEKLYYSEDFVSINLEEYIKSLLRTHYANDDIDPEMCSVILNINPECRVGLFMAVPAGIILNELLTNSIRHACDFENNEKLEIIISFNKKGDEYFVLDFQDNGRGFPDGVSFKTPESLGLKLISILAEDQLNGVVKVQSGKGLSYHILLPDNKS